MRVGSRKWIAAAASAMIALPVPAAPQAASEPPPLAAIDSGFVCPEKLGSDSERKSVLAAFVKAYAQARPDATVAEMLAYRRALLTKHGCTGTLRRLDAADVAIAAGDVRSQPWFPILDTGGIKLAVSATHVTPTLDPRSPDEKAVDTYTRIQFAVPAVTNVTHTRYDEVVSHNVYYCESRRYALIENDYFLAGTLAFKDASSIAARSSGGAALYEIDAIPPGSLNERAASRACNVAKGSVS